MTLDNRGGATCVFDIALGAGGVIACEINTLTLANDREVELQLGTGLRILGAADLCGPVEVIGGVFEAPSASLECGRSRLFARNGGVLQAYGAAYSPKGLVNSRGCCSVVTDNWEVLLADGVGSTLDLSAATLLDDGHSGGAYTRTNHYVIARNGGEVRLPGLQEVKAPAAINDLTWFLLETGGTIDLGSLRKTGSVGRGRTMVEATGGSVLALPSLEIAEDTYLRARSGGQVIASGAQPLVLDWRGIVNSRGCCSVVTDDWEVLLADGVGSTLDLSAATLLDDGHSGGAYTRTNHYVIARNGGEVLLPGLTQINLPRATNDATRVSAIGGGMVDLSGLRSVDSAGSGSFTVSATDGGQMMLGTLAVEGRGSLTIDGAGSMVHVLGDVAPMAPWTIDVRHAEARFMIDGDCDLSTITTLSVADGSVVSFGGDFTHAHTASSSVDLSHATMLFKGGGVEQSCEVGGANFGVNACFLADDNFGFGQLVVGEPGRPARVRLVDQVDNGHGGGVAESLYLWGSFDRSTCAVKHGLAEIEGLHVLGGSILDIGACIDVYARHYDDDSMTWTWLSLHSLFAPGQDVIAFDEGFIQRTVCYADCDQSTGTCTLDIFDFLCFQNEFAVATPYACDCDSTTGVGVCDIFDFLCFQNAFASGCP